MSDGVGDTCPRSPGDNGDVNWIPDVAHPVAWGAEDVPGVAGVHRSMMIHYPIHRYGGESVPETNTARAVGPFGPPPILKLCGVRWPTVLFLHGGQPFSYSKATYYRRWRRLPAVLARSGYVVVVPSHVANIVLTEADLAAAQQDLEWVRNGWTQSHWVSKRREFVVAGHSNGALMASYMAARVPEVVALVWLGGQYESLPDVINVLLNLAKPKLMMWTWRERNENLRHLFTGIPRAKHGVSYNGGHFDYLDPADTEAFPRGPCPLIGAVAADLVALFVASTFQSLTQVPDDLSRPQVSLTSTQQIYAAGHLSSLDQISSTQGCSVDFQWDLDKYSQGSRWLGAGRIRSEQTASALSVRLGAARVVQGGRSRD